jgi:hypothetical protein
VQKAIDYLVGTYDWNHHYWPATYENVNDEPHAFWRRGLVLGLLFTGLMGSSQLQAIDLLPDAIWPGHLAEVVVAWGLRPLPAKGSTDDVSHLAT